MSWVSPYMCMPVSLRERAIELLGELYKGQLPMYEVDDDSHDLRAHILRRLRRLCTLPDDARLAEVAKQALKETFAFKPPPSEWRQLVCGRGGSGGVSIAGTALCVVLVPNPVPSLGACSMS